MKRYAFLLTFVFVLAALGVEGEEHYTVQTGSFKNLQTAQTFMKQLRGKSCFLEQRGNYFVVYCGRFEEKTDAKTLAENLRKHGFTDVMVKKVSSDSSFQEKTESSVITITPSSAHIWVDVSMSDVNRFFCQKEDVSDVVFSAEKGIQVKIKGKNAFVKLVPIEVTDQLTGKVSYRYRKKPFEIYIVCGDEVYSLIARPQRIPARTFILEVPYQPDAKKSFLFFKERTFEQSLLDLTLAAIREEIPHGFSVVDINAPYSSYNEIDIILRRKLKGGSFELKEFLITAKTEVTLSENMFFSENPSSVCILDLKLNPGQTTRAFVITRKKDTFPSLRIQNKQNKTPALRKEKKKKKKISHKKTPFFKTIPVCDSDGCGGNP